MSLNIKAYVMLVLASIFWAGNFIIGKFAFVESISPFSLVFFRWLTVWFILLPFTYKEILSKKKEISNNLPLLLFLGLTSVGLFNSFVYVSLQYTQVINASLFNTAIPAAIILSCFDPVRREIAHLALKKLVLEHSEETGSNLSKQIADNFENELKNFVQVCPKEMVDKLNHPISTKTKIQKVS